MYSFLRKWKKKEEAEKKKEGNIIIMLYDAITWDMALHCIATEHFLIGWVLIGIGLVWW